MRLSTRMPGCAAVALLLGCVGVAGAQNQPRGDASRATLPIPVQSLAINYRDAVARVVDKPTIVAKAGADEFVTGIYPWLLDHPDRASLAWRRLGIPCAEIVDRGQGRFGWSDGEGTEVAWLTVCNTEDCRIWYAEGRAVLAPRLPAIAIKAVAVLRHEPVQHADGRVVTRHLTDIYLVTDSKAAGLLAKMLGPAMPRLAEQGAGQLLLFFSGLTRYFAKYPQDIEPLLATK